MKRLSGIYFLIFVLLLTAISCKKEEDVLPTDRADSPLLLPAIPANADAVCLAVRSVNPPLLPGLPDAESDVVYATFGVAEPFSDVGELRVNNTPLRRLPNNTYFNGDLVLNYNLLGGSRPRWVAEGGGGFAAFNVQTPHQMPATVKFKEVEDTYDLSLGVILRIEALPNFADSVIWQLGDVRGNVVRKVNAAAEVTFSPAELFGLQPSPGCIIQVGAFSSRLVPVAGRQFFMVNQTADQEFVSFR